MSVLTTKKILIKLDILIYLLFSLFHFILFSEGCNSKFEKFYYLPFNDGFVQNVRVRHESLRQKLPSHGWPTKFKRHLQSSKIINENTTLEVKNVTNVWYRIAIEDMFKARWRRTQSKPMSTYKKSCNPHIVAERDAWENIPKLLKSWWTLANFWDDAKYVQPRL